jgi:hypothetical protein
MTSRAQIETRITAVEYVKRGTKTLAFVALDNGWVQSGEADCVNPAIYDSTVGAQIAYEDAVNQLWPLLGFLEKEDAYRAQKALDGVRPE